MTPTAPEEPASMSVVAAPAEEPASMSVVAAPAIGLYEDIPLLAVAESRARALKVNEIAKKSHDDTNVGVRIPTGQEITLLKNKHQNNPVRVVKTPVEYLTQLVYDLENQGDPSVKRDILSHSKKIGENQYISTNGKGQKFTVRTKDKFAVDESDDEVKIVCAHCPEQWTVDDLNTPNGHGIYLLGVHAYHCGEQGLPWEKNMDLFLWIIHVRLMIMPSEKEGIGGYNSTGIAKCPLRSHRDGSDKITTKLHLATMMGIEEFDQICAEQELPARDPHIMLWLDETASVKLVKKLRRILVRGSSDKKITKDQWFYLCEMGFHKIISEHIQQECGYLHHNDTVDGDRKIAALPSSSVSKLPSTAPEIPQLPDTSDLYPHDSDWAPMLNMSPPTVGDWDPMTSEWSPMITDWSPTFQTDALQVKKMTPSQMEQGVSLQSTSDPNAQGNSDIAEV